MKKAKRGKKWISMIIAVLLLPVYSLTAYGESSDVDDADVTLAPYFFVENAGKAADSFPLKGTEVSTNINGTIADTYVVQTYANEGKKPINATYVFPASTKVSVHGMKMEIGDKVITAKIKEREEAKQEFEQAKSEGKSASLLEQQRPNVFTMNVANIMPGDTIRIELHYTELIVPTEGVYQFVFPTVVGPRYASPSQDSNAKTNKWVASPYISDGGTPPGEYNITANISTGVPISGLTSNSHDIDVAWDGESAAKVTLSDPEEFAGNRDFILEYKLTGEKVQSGLILNAGETENFFMLTIQPPERFTPEDIPPREYIFVLDVSGSMSGYPLDTAKELIKSLVTNLHETDTFNLILFSNGFAIMSDKSLPATKGNINRAINMIGQQNGGGGTELSKALRRAVFIPKEEDVARSVIVITDGYISGESAIFDIINECLGKTSFFSFGIGTSVNRYLIEGIAKAGLGESFVVTEASEASDAAERFREYVQSPILTDIHIAYDGFEAYDIEPANLPTLFAQRPLVLFGKWRGEPSGTVKISGKSGAHDYVQHIQVSDIEPRESNSAIRFLWARTKVDSLMYYGLDQGAPDAKKEITAIGLEYSMLTPYTSFTAVLDTIRNNEESADVSQPLPLPLNVSNLAVGEGYAIGSEPESALLISVILFMAAVFFVKSRAGRVRNNDI